MCTDTTFMKLRLYYLSLRSNGLLLMEMVTDLEGVQDSCHWSPRSCVHGITVCCLLPHLPLVSAAMMLLLRHLPHSIYVNGRESGSHSFPLLKSASVVLLRQSGLED